VIIGNHNSSQTKVVERGPGPTDEPCEAEWKIIIEDSGRSNPQPKY
jgi:hypothetical protein